MSDLGIAALLHGLVSVPSLSGSEAEASSFLVGQMQSLGFERAYVDEAGNAVGERGPEAAARVLMLLGHIDTVPGEIPVRFERVGDDELLHGRGTVDAKGPLATFVMAASRIDAELLIQQGVKLVVVGAVEEESATSRGARAIRDRFDGTDEPVPLACIIGEPSRFHRVTLGYKGRLLIDARAERELTHTAGPDPGIGVQLIGLWNLLAAEAEAFNRESARPFAQLQPSLRSMQCGVDGGMLSWAEASFGIRLPPFYDVEALLRHTLCEWSELAVQLERAAALSAGELHGVDSPPVETGSAESGFSAAWRVGERRLELAARGYEPAWKSDRSSSLVRAFQRSIREAGERPGFVVKTGTSDMNVVGPAWRCPILAYGPGDSALDHTPHEHVSVLELERALEVLEGAMLAWLQSLSD